MTAEPKPHLTDHQDDEIAEYRALSGSAVGGLGLGLLSATALVHPLMWLVPLAGVGLSTLALRRIAEADPALVGRKAALAGLVLSVLFGVAGMADWAAYQALARREGRQFAEHWFELLARQDPQKAFQLTLSPRYRQPLDEGLAAFYREGPRWHRELLDYVERPLVRTLLALGDRAVVRYWGTDGQQSDGERDVLSQIFAVTFDDPDEGRKKTFFVALTLHRVKTDDGRAFWRVYDTATDFKPEGL